MEIESRRTAYRRLKNTIKVIYPNKVIVVEKLHELHKSKRKLIKEISKSNINTDVELIDSKRKKITEIEKLIKRVYNQN